MEMSRVLNREIWPKTDWNGVITLSSWPLTWTDSSSDVPTEWMTRFGSQRWTVPVVRVRMNESNLNVKSMIPTGGPAASSHTDSHAIDERSTCSAIVRDPVSSTLEGTIAIPHTTV